MIDHLPFLLFVLVATITRGGATTLAASCGAHFGWRRSLPFITGIAAGLASMAAASAAGLGGLILAYPALQLAMKIAGSDLSAVADLRDRRICARPGQGRSAFRVRSGFCGITPRAGR